MGHLIAGRGVYSSCGTKRGRQKKVLFSLKPVALPASLCCCPIPSLSAQVFCSSFTQMGCLIQDILPAIGCTRWLHYHHFCSVAPLFQCPAQEQPWLAGPALTGTFKEVLAAPHERTHPKRIQQTLSICRCFSALSSGQVQAQWWQ